MPRFTITVVAVSCFTLAACQKDSRPVSTTSQDGASLSAPADSAQARGNALVRIVNAVAGGKTISAQVSGSTLFSEVMQGAVSDYIEIGPNLSTFSVNIPGGTEVYTVTSQDQMLRTGTRYTIFLIAEDASNRVLRVVRDDVVPEIGKARIRVLHAAPGGPNLDVMATNGMINLFTNVAFKSAAGYADVSPAKVDLEFRATTGGRVLLRVPELDLQPATAMTIVVTGGSTLQYIVFTDAMMERPPRA
jgi:hypothetical protein